MWSCDAGTHHFDECRADSETNRASTGCQLHYRGQVAASVLRQWSSPLYDLLRPGRPRSVSDERVAQLVKRS